MFVTKLSEFQIWQSPSESTIRAILFIFGFGRLMRNCKTHTDRWMRNCIKHIQTGGCVIV